jgi:uncharacterized membrane protein
MSDTIPPDDVQIARASYDRTLAETGRMLAETRKFVAEQNRLTDERIKRQAEARKYDRERWIILIGAIGGVTAAVASIVTLLKTLH